MGHIKGRRCLPVSLRGRLYPFFGFCLGHEFTGSLIKQNKKKVQGIEIDSESGKENGTACIVARIAVRPLEATGERMGGNCKGSTKH